MSKRSPQAPAFSRLDSAVSHASSGASYSSGGGGGGGGGSQGSRGSQDDSLYRTYRTMRALSESSSGSSASSVRLTRRDSTASGSGASDGSSVEGSFVWLVVVRAKPEHTEELAAFLKGVSERILENEPDVLTHRVLRGVEDQENDSEIGGKFVVYAEFRNDDAFDSHLQSDEFQKFVNNADLLAGPPQLLNYRDVSLPDDTDD